MALGGFLLFAGIAHQTFAREAFRAQVPPWVPLDIDLVVVLSGIVEIGLGLALWVWRRRLVRQPFSKPLVLLCIENGFKSATHNPRKSAKGIVQQVSLRARRWRLEDG